MSIAATTLLLIGVIPLSLSNGNFSHVVDGKAVGWESTKAYQVIPGGGRNGMPAIEFTCADKSDSAGATQWIKFDRPRYGAFEVSSWVRVDNADIGTECGMDVPFPVMDPFWEKDPSKYCWKNWYLAPANFDKKGWQKLTATVVPSKPVKEIQIALTLRAGKSTARFCDVQVRDLPLKIKTLNVSLAGKAACDIRSDLSEDTLWTIRAIQGGKDIWTHSGEGRFISERFPISGVEPINVEVTANRNGTLTSANASVTPKSNTPLLEHWVENSSNRVFQDDLPPSKPVTKALLEAARNDRESFQICLRAADTPLENLQVSISGLKQRGNVSIPASQIQWFRVGYIWVEQPFPHPYTPRTGSAWWPDPLLPGVPFSIKPWQVQPLLFTVHAPKNATPGKYTGEITISSEGKALVKTPISLTVYPAVIPDQGYMKTAFGSEDRMIEPVYGGKLSPKLRRAYTDYLLAHHINPFGYWVGDNGPDMDELKYADKNGLNAFEILNMSVAIQDKPEDYASKKNAFLAKLDKLMPELEKCGLASKAHVYGFDECGPEFVPAISELYGEVKKRYPILKTSSTCWSAARTLNDIKSLNVDWIQPQTCAYDPRAAREFRKQGGEMWWYVSLQPNYPYANWLLENPLVEARSMFWQAYQNDVEGFLYWGTAVWWRSHNDKPIPSNAEPRLEWSVTTGGEIYPSLNGDGTLMYPGTDGPLGSLRLESIRDGLEDIELLKQYQEQFGKESAEKIAQQVSTDITHFSRDPNVLLNARRHLLRSIR